MIDAQEMVRRSMEGIVLIDSLGEDEEHILKHFCSLVTEAILKDGVRRKAPFEDVAINALRQGIAIGLRLKVEAGEIKGRD